MSLSYLVYVSTWASAFNSSNFCNYYCEEKTPGVKGETTHENHNLYCSPHKMYTINSCLHLNLVMALRDTTVKTLMKINLLTLLTCPYGSFHMLQDLSGVKEAVSG